ncbi:hypothetical protein EAH76_03155 [Sphingomonas glacialis]|uniref:Secretin/TonB short N-terminal domain-containing protein n=2 Tax=Sphingomonas glacialis TaxID=658225 RepID=A0A502G3Z9_9SPHN|nr:hypothetical protein EAH76_03155 [Sphingomonas glacialis]
MDVEWLGTSTERHEFVGTPVLKGSDGDTEPLATVDRCVRSISRRYGSRSFQLPMDGATLTGALGESQMRRRHYVVAVTAALTAMPAAAAPKKIHLNPGRLTTALSQLGAQAGINLLFSPADVGDRQTSGLDGNIPPDSALDRLLLGSGLAFRRTADGAFVIYRVPDASVAQQALPDIVVVGRRTQNADIRRTTNDIQPYRVATAREIGGSSTDNADQFLRNRLPANAELRTPSQNPADEFGSTRSEIDLHGLGPEQTLVLVDGLRMPSIPSLTTDLLQPDINGLPLGSIERIETLSTSASGIYGPGATGGVVNVVLKRDYRGAALTVDTSLSEHGGGDRRRVEARLGFTPDHGTTDVMVDVGYQTIDTLREGQRSLTERTNAVASLNAPTAYLFNFPTADAVTVFSQAGNLSLKPAFGSGTLGAGNTYLALTTPRTPATVSSELVANAGTIPTTLSPDANGEDRPLLSGSSALSILGSVRHHFSPAIEGFVDFIGLENRGSALGQTAGSSGFVSGSAPTNPFAQGVQITFPLPGFETALVTRTKTARVTIGMIASLPKGWKADGSYSFGGVRNEIDQSGTTLSYTASQSLSTGRPGTDGKPSLNPFGDWQTFVTNLAAYRTSLTGHFLLKNDFSDANLRLAGPILRLPGGELTLTTLVERRRESEPVSTVTGSTEFAPDGYAYQTPNVSEQVTSGYAELRAPIGSPEAKFPGLRSLELQLAIRYDRMRLDAPSFSDLTTGDAERASAHYGTTNYTVGVRAFPLKLLMVRASVATGSLPPTPSQIGGYRTSILVQDAQRGNSFNRVAYQDGGSLQLQPESARSFSIGAVFNPNGRTGPRLSIDYVLLEKRREIVALGLTSDQLISNEAAFPDRVVRATLTDADRALGYTAGALTLIDATSINGGHSRVQTVDIDLSWAIAFHKLGTARFYGAATWEPEFSQQIALDGPWIRRDDHSDGPLDWKGNAGIDWSLNRLSVGLNGQYYSSYYVSASYGTPSYILALQGADRVPAQVYLDLDMSYRIDVGRSEGRPREMIFRAGVTNFLNHAPPALYGGPGYSFYGDPRMRRFSFSVASAF